MCGFSGLLTSQKFEVSLFEEFKKISKKFLHHRGPDSSGEFFHTEKIITLTHTRLAILDLSKEGFQPMESVCKNYVIVFNGEIYNHLDLRKKYGSNHKWRGSSDTETLLYCFAKKGVESILKECRGMYALCLYDKKKSKVFVARDITGEKPLYYISNESYFCFASEIKVLNHFSKSILIDKKELINYFDFGYTNSSLFQNIRKLEPATFIEVDLLSKKIINKKKFWNRTFSKNIKINNSKLIDDLDNHLFNSVKRQIISDVPIGCFLSGGIDSSIVAYYMSIISKEKINTFSIGFDDPRYSELQYSEHVSKTLNTNHTTHIISENEALETLDFLLGKMDEPFADNSIIPTYIISKIAKKKIKVALTGDGADELFGGYNRYYSALDVHNKLNKCPKFIKHSLFKLLNSLKVKQNFSNIKYFKFLSVLENSDFKNIYTNFLSNNCSSLILKKKFQDKLKIQVNNIYKDSKDFGEYMLDYDFNNYLPNNILKKVDSMTMLCGLEARSPFLDKDLIEFSHNLPMNLKIVKNSNKKILRDILDKKLALKTFKRQKQGFSIPFDKWLQRPLFKDWANDLINSHYNDLDFIDFEFIKLQWNIFNQKSGKTNWPIIWNILVFLGWFKKNSNVRIL